MFGKGIRRALKILIRSKNQVEIYIVSEENSTFSIILHFNTNIIFFECPKYNILSALKPD